MSKLIILLIVLLSVVVVHSDNAYSQEDNPNATIAMNGEVGEKFQQLSDIVESMPLVDKLENISQTLSNDEIENILTSLESSQELTPVMKAMSNEFKVTMTHNGTPNQLMHETELYPLMANEMTEDEERLLDIFQGLLINYAYNNANNHYQLFADNGQTGLYRTYIDVWKDTTKRAENLRNYNQSLTNIIQRMFIPMGWTVDTAFFDDAWLAHDNIIQTSVKSYSSPLGLEPVVYAMRIDQLEQLFSVQGMNTTYYPLTQDPFIMRYGESVGTKFYQEYSMPTNMGGVHTKDITSGVMNAPRSTVKIEEESSSQEEQTISNQEDFSVSNESSEPIEESVEAPQVSSPRPSDSLNGMSDLRSAVDQKVQEDFRADMLLDSTRSVDYHSTMIRYGDNGATIVFNYWVNTNFVYSYFIENVFIDANGKIIPEKLRPQNQRWDAKFSRDQVIERLRNSGFEQY